MKRPAPQTLAAAMVLGILALITILTARNEPVAFDSFASTDFSPGGCSAWAALLERERITTTRFVRRPIELDAHINTLVSAQPVAAATDPAARTAADIGALAAWVKRGGRLVYIGRNSALRDAENQLLQLPFLLPDVGGRGRFGGALSTHVRSLDGLGANRMLLIEHSGQAELSDGNGDIVVRYPLGRGEVVASVDAVPFSNEHIARADNARMAYAISVPGRTGGLVAFDDGVHGALIDRPWYRALPVPVRVGLGLAAIALLLGLIGSMLRGGPPMGLRPAREPTSSEFIAALAALHERIGARGPARDVLARAALAAAARSVGLPDDAPPELLAQRLEDRRHSGDVRRLTAELGTALTSDRVLLASAKLALIVRRAFTNDGHGDRPRSAFTGRSRTRRRW